MNAGDSLLAYVGECFVCWLVPECSYLLLFGGCYKMSAVFTCLTSGLCQESLVIRGLFVLAPSGFAYLAEGGIHSREFYGRCFKIVRLNVEWFCLGSHAGWHQSRKIYCGWLRWSEFAAGICLQVGTPCLSYTVS